MHLAALRGVSRALALVAQSDATRRHQIASVLREAGYDVWTCLSILSFKVELNSRAAYTADTLVLVLGPDLIPACTEAIAAFSDGRFVAGFTRPKVVLTYDTLPIETPGHLPGCEVQQVSGGPLNAAELDHIVRQWRASTRASITWVE
jgi:hypothetical protein